MRMLTWNIRTGGGNRLPTITKVLQRERPDLLALQELRGFDAVKLGELAAALGMESFLARSLFGQPVAVLVRPPLRVLRTHAVTWRLHHAAASVSVATPSGPLTVVSTHLNPFSPYRRMREATWLAVRHHRGAVVLAGDLNSLDPHDDHASALASLAPAYRRRHLSPDGVADTRAIAAFERAGLRDLWRTAGAGDGHTVPTLFGGDEFGGMRLDYLLATAAVDASDMRVVRDELTDHASDHYPLRAEISL